jgi:streptogramin lyase
MDAGGAGTLYVSGTGVVNAFALGSSGTATPIRSLWPHPNQTDAIDGVAVASDATLNILQDYQAVAPGSVADCRVVVESSTTNGTGPRQNQFTCNVGGAAHGISIARDPNGIAYLENVGGVDYVARNNSALHQTELDQSLLRLATAGHNGIAVGYRGRVFVSSNRGLYGLAQIETYAPSLAKKVFAIIERVSAGALALAPDNTTLYVATSDAIGQRFVDRVTAVPATGDTVRSTQAIGPWPNFIVTALAVDQESRLYVGLSAVDGSSSHIRVYAPDAGSGKPASLYVLQNPVPPPQQITAIAVDELPAVAQPRPPSGAVTEFAAGITPGSRPGAMTRGPDGNLWFVELSDRIGRITPAGMVTEFSAGITAGSVPNDITSGPDGNLWFTESGGNRIGRITPAGVVTEFSAGITSGAGPEAITAGPDGNLWFTENNGTSVGQVTPNGVITEFPGGRRAGGAAGITAGADGNLYFTETFYDLIARMPPGGTVTEIVGIQLVNSGMTPTNPEGITAGPDGNVWFTEHKVSRIGRLTRFAVISEFPIPAGSQPWFITSGPDGNLWFTEAPNGIGRITPGGSITEFSAGITSRSSPYGIASGADGAVWFTEFAADRIGRITP